MALTTQVRYGIMLPDGSLARVTNYKNNGDCCGEYTYKLTDDPSEPEWLVEDPAAVAKTLFADVCWYNSDSDHPCWGKFKREQMRPAKVIIQVDVAPTDEVKIPVNLSSLEVRDIPWSLAKMYSGNPDLPREGKRYVFILTTLTVEEAKQHQGNVVCFDDNLYNPRLVVAVAPVPEDYVDPDEEIVRLTNRGKPQSLLICEAID